MKNEWAESVKIAVWQKAKSSNNPAVYRMDVAGAWMQYENYGITDNELGFGWEIDHIVPVAKGGSDNINNLQALQWYNNRTKSDDYPRYTTAVSSSEGKNIYFKKQH